MNLSSANKTYTIFLWCKRNYWHRLIDGDQDRHLHPFFFFFSLSFVRNIDDDPTVYKACKLVNVSQVLSSSFNCPLLSSIMPRTSSKPKTLPAVYVEMYVLLHYCYYECCSNNLLLIAKSLLVLEMAVLLEWRSLPPSPSKCVLHFSNFSIWQFHQKSSQEACLAKVYQEDCTHGIGKVCSHCCSIHVWLSYTIFHSSSLTEDELSVSSLVMNWCWWLTGTS